MAGDEFTSMISVHSKPNRRRKLVSCKGYPLRVTFMTVYLLLLLTEVIVTAVFVYYYSKTISPIFTSKSMDTTNVSTTKNTSDTFHVQLGRYFNITKTYSKLITALNCLDTLNCWIFLGTVVTSPHFSGWCTMMNNLIRLPRFWTLIVVFVLYVTGDIVEIVSSHTLPIVYKFREMMIVCLTFVLNAFSLTVIIAALNQTKVRHLGKGRAYLLFKGALSVFCFRLLVYLTLTIFHLTVILYLIAGVKNTFWRKEGAFTNSVSTFLFLPFYKRGTELIWTKILRDDKGIIGKVNHTERQDRDLSSDVEAVQVNQNFGDRAEI